VANLVGGQAYRRRSVPYVPKGTDGKPKVNDWAQKMVAWLAEEFGYVQQATLRDTTRAVSAATTATVADGTILADATSAPFTVTLPAAADAMNMTLTVVRTNGGGNAVTIGGTVSGVVNPTLGSQYSAKTVRSSGSGTSWSWILVANV